MSHTSSRPDTFSSGAGGWDGKVVLITYARAERRALGRADNPYRNEQGEIQYLNALIVKGIAEGQEKEITREFEAPRSLRASEDGEGFVDARTGGPGKITKNSALGKFFAAYDKAGGDFAKIETATADGVTAHYSGLTGAKMLFRAEPQLDKNKQQKIDKNGYSLYDFFPEQVIGQGRGPGAVTKSNGADLDAVKALVRSIVEASPEKSVSRSQLVQAVTKQQPGALQYVLRDQFLRDSGVNYDGANLSL